LGILISVIPWSARVPLILAVALSACQFDSTGSGASGGASSGSGEEIETSTTSGRVDTSGDTRASGSASSDETGEASASMTVGPDGTTEATTESQAKCEHALLITDDANVTAGIDAPLYDRLLDLGVSVTIVSNAESGPDDVADNCVVIVSASGASVDVNTKFLNAPVGVVLLEPALYDDMRLVASSSELGWSDGHDNITIIEPQHPLAAGLSGTVSIYEGGGRVSWGLPVESAQVVATWPDNANRATLIGYEKGAEMAHGFIAPARRVGFPGGTTSAPMTAERIDLFEAAVLWAADDIP
jgi:hypothetical protein